MLSMSTLRAISINMIINTKDHLIITRKFHIKFKNANRVYAGAID